jgi:hypothetical protein
MPSRASMHRTRKAIVQCKKAIPEGPQNQFSRAQNSSPIQHTWIVKHTDMYIYIENW